MVTIFLEFLKKIIKALFDLYHNIDLNDAELMDSLTNKMLYFNYFNTV